VQCIAVGGAIAGAARCRRQGTGFRLHDLRHSFASVAVMSGASLFDVQKLLGHKSIEMTQRYAHLSADALKEATERVAVALEQSRASRRASNSEGKPGGFPPSPPCCEKGGGPGGPSVFW
jgi:hypothetical protein